MIDVIATIVAIVSLIAAIGAASYLFLLQSAAKKKGASGSPVLADVRKRLPVVAAAVAGAALSLVLATGDSTFADIAAIVLGGASGAVAGNALTAVRNEYRPS